MIPLSWIIAIILGIMGGIGAYFMWQWGSAITTGVQQAAPGLGAAIGSLGFIIAMMPMFMMFMFIIMFMNMMMGMVRW